jgi:hypothetical protein
MQWLKDLVMINCTSCKKCRPDLLRLWHDFWHNLVNSARSRPDELSDSTSADNNKPPRPERGHHVSRRISSEDKRKRMPSSEISFPLQVTF